MPSDLHALLIYWDETEVETGRYRKGLVLSGFFVFPIRRQLAGRVIFLGFLAQKILG